MAIPVADKSLQRPDFDTFIANNLPATGASNVPNALLPASPTGADSSDPMAELAKIVHGTQESLAINQANPIPVSEIDTSGRYPFYHPGRNNEDIYASGQGILAQAGSGLLKGLSLAGTTFLQGTVGLLTGAAAWINSGKFSSFYNNEFNQSLDRWNQYLENEILPNYYSQKQTDAAWYSPDNWFTANFLWDKVIKNLGFAAGAYLSGAAYTKAINAITSASKLGSIGRVFEAATEAENAVIAAGNNVQKLGSVAGKFKQISDNAITKYNFLNQGQRAVVAGLSTIGEAGFEAMHNANNTRQELIDTFYQENGYYPSGAQLQEINQRAEEIGNTSFFLNSGLLSVSNYIQFPRILGTSYKASKSIANDFATKTNTLLRETGKETFRELKYTFPKLNKGLKATRYLFNPTEAAEEGGQFAIQTGVQNYFDKQYTSNDADIFEDMIGHGIAQVFGSKEGMENLIIGGISGAIMTARGTFKENQALKRQTAEALAALNGTNGKNKTMTGFMMDSVAALKRGTQLQQEQEAAVRQGEILEAKDLEQDFIHNWLMPRLKYGRFDAVIEDINNYKAMAATEDGMTQLQTEGKASELDTRETFIARLNNLEAYAKNAASLYESLNLRYKGAILPDGSRAYPDEVIDKMVYAASKVSNYDQRMTDVANILTARGVNVAPILLENESPLDNVVNQIVAMDVLEEYKEEALQFAEDYFEMAARREKFLKEYAEIRNTPAKYKPADVIPPASGGEPEKPKEATTKETIKIKTKDGEKDIVVGEEYYLGVVEGKDKKGNQTLSFPRLKILGKNEDGTFKIQGSNGQIKNVTAQQLEKYKLGKVADAEKNKKAKFFIEHSNDVFEFNFGKGKTQRGQLEYHPDTNRMYFVYLDSKGNPKDIEVTGDMFVPKKGFKKPLINKVGTLTPIQEKALEEFSTAQDDRIQEKRKARLEIIEELVNEHGARLETITKKIAANTSQLTNLNNALKGFRDNIEQAEATPKGNMKKQTKEFLAMASTMSRMKNELEQENAALESEKQDLEMTLEYLYDFQQYIDELPTDSTEFLATLKEETENVETLIKLTGESMNKITKLITNVTKAFNDAVDLVMELIGKMEKTYRGVPMDTRGQPWRDFIAKNPNFLKLNPFFKEDLQRVEELVAQIEDLDVKPNERTLKELQESLAPLEAEMASLEKEYKAKLTIYEKFKKKADVFAEQERIRKQHEANKKLHEKIFGQQKKLAKESGIVSDAPNPEGGVFESPRKSVEWLFSSTTAPSENLQEHHIREQALLNNYPRIKNRKDLRIILVTQNNENALGLKGLIAKMGGDKEAIAAVYTIQKGEELHFIDVNGESIGKVGQQADNVDISNMEEGEAAYHLKTATPAISLERAVYSNLPTTELTWKDGDNRFRENQKDEVEGYQKAWVEQRKTILGWKGTEDTQVFPFNVSMGFPKRNITKENGKNVYEANSVLDTHITEEDLETEGLIEVSTTGFIVHPTTGERLSVKPGRAILKTENSLVWLNNRNLSEEEVQSMYKVLKQFVADSYNGNVNERIARYIQGVLYFGRPQEGKEPVRNQIWFQGGRIHIGKHSFPFTPQDFEANKAEILTFLRGTYNNVNNFKLNKDNYNKPYEEIYDIDKNGEPISRVWKSYQHYLLSKTYDLVEGDESVEKGKPRKDIPLTTTVRKLAPNIPNDSNYEQRYAMLKGELFTLPEGFKKNKKQPTKETKKEASKTPAKGGYVLDGKTKNQLQTKFGVIEFTAINDDGINVGVDVNPDVVDKFQEDPLSKKFEGDEGVADFFSKIAIAAVQKQIKEGKTSSAPKKPESTPIKQGFVLDGKTKNKFTTKFGDIEFTATNNNGISVDVEISDETVTAFSADPISEKFQGDDGAADFFTRISIAAIQAQLKAVPQATEKEASTITPVKVVTTEEEERLLQKARELKEKAKKSGAKPLPEDEFRILTQGHWQKANIDAEQKWFEDRFNVPFHRVKTMIDNGAGGAFGKFADAAVYVWENAEVGTTYHEAFHAVYQMFTSLKEKQAIIQEFKNRTGTFTDRETGVTKRYKDATDKEIREALAEEFRAYVLTGKKPNRTKGNWLQRLFADLANFIKRVLLGNEAGIYEMFKRMSNGFYKNATPINHASVEPEYMAIAGFNEQISRSIVEGVTSRLFTKLFKEGKHHLIEFDEVAGTPEELYRQVRIDLEEYYTIHLPAPRPDGTTLDDATMAKYLAVWENIDANWNLVKENVNSYLKTFGIIAKMNENGDTEIIDSTEEDPNTTPKEANDETSNREYGRDEFKYDFKKNAPTSVKLLFATLTEVVAQAGDITSTTAVRNKETSLEQQVKYAKVFNQTLAALMDVNTMEEKAAALKELGKSFPNVIRLFNRLRLNVSNQAISVDDWRLRVRFFNVVSKQSPTALINYIDEAGNSYTGAAELSEAADLQVQKWIDALKVRASEKGSNIVLVDKTTQKYTLSPAVLKSFKIKDLSGAISFLNELGIDFTETIYKRLPKSKKKEFDEAVGQLYTFLQKAEGFTAASARSLDVGGPMNAIAQAYIKGLGEEWESTFLNIEGQKVQKYILPNFFSNTVNDINSVQTLEELYEKLPQLKDTDYAQGSRYIRLDSPLFKKDGSKKDKGLKIKYIQGTIDQTQNRSTFPTEKLNPAQRLLQEINQNIQGNYYILVPADSKTEWMLGLGNLISFEEFDYPGVTWNRIYSIFNEYYRVEKEMFNDDGKKRLLYDLSNGYKAESINDGLKQFVEEMVNQQKEFIMSYGLYNGTTLSGLDTPFVKTSMTNGVTEENLNKLLTFRTVNYMINNTEFHKIFFGDPAEYKDPTKRYKSFLSPREASYYGDKAYNKMANEQFNKAGNIRLNNGDPGFTIFSDTMSVRIYNDVIGYNKAIAEDKHIPEEIRNAYKTNNGTDAQSWATLTGYRQILKRSGDRWTNAHEQQFQYLMAVERDLLAKDGLYIYKNEALKTHDEALLKKGNPHSAVFPVLKPIGTGFTDANIPFLHKTSLVPLWYSSVRGTNLSKVYTRMVEDGIDYSIVISGEKVGNTGANDFYSQEGDISMDIEPAFDKGIPFRYYGIQVETMGEKNKQPRGSQMTKLVLSNLMDGGVPIDVKYTLDDWEKLTEQDKLSESPVYREINKNIELLNILTEANYDLLLKKFGITDLGNRYEIADKSKVAKLLHNELFRREVAENIREALTLDENGEFTIPLEAIPNYGQIKAILYSQVDKHLGSPKMNGGPKVQVSGSMWESAGIREAKIVTKKGKEQVVYVSRGLKFYEPEYDSKGNITKVGRMQVMLPNWVAKKLRSKGHFKTDAELIKAMTPEMLSGVGFRIPTQEMSSIEAFEIAGFLPEEMGDTVVVPEEITTKAGSDFDVDKLSTYLKNIHVTATGQLHLVTYQGSEQATRAYYDKFFDDAIEEAKKKAQKTKEWAGKQSDFFETYMFADETEEEAQERADRFNDIAAKQEKKLVDLSDVEKLAIQKEYFVDKMYMQALENEYFNSLERLILAPHNFLRLINPNTSKELTDLRESLNEVLGKDSSPKGGILNPLYMSETRHNFIVGKSGISIAAVNQTNNVMSQLGNVYLNGANLKRLKPDVRKWIKNLNIALPHNKIVIGGREFPTLSRIKDQAKRYISDKVSQYINGYVDIAKDAFIVELGATPQLAGTFLFLEKVGVPTEDIVYFMNQPIIREYVKELAAEQKVWLFDEKRVNRVKDVFPSKESATTINVNELKNNIGKYYKTANKFTDAENAEQRFILDEFLKYAMMARQLFEFTQATNYDTANFSDSNLYYKKKKMTEKARNNNIFSSVDSALDNTHVGLVAKRLDNAANAIGSTLIKIESAPVRRVLETVMDELLDKIMTEKQFQKAARKIEESFISYLIQTKTQLNNRVKDLMIDEQTAVALEIAKIQKEAKKNPESDLANNAFLNFIAPAIGEKTTSTKTLNLVQKVSDAYTSNMLTGALRELKNINYPLYGKIIRLAFLQSGISKNPISFSDLIPWEDYSRVVSPVLQNLENSSEFISFAEIDAYYRNNWRDDSIVPREKDKFKHIEGEYTTVIDPNTGEEKHVQKLKTNRIFGKEAAWLDALKKDRGYVNEDRFIAYKFHENSLSGKSRFLLIQRIKPEFKNKGKVTEAMAKKKDYSFLEQVLVRRVDDIQGNPVPVKYFPEANFHYYVYMPINAWGDSLRAQEYYDAPRMSVLDNGTYKVKAEIPNSIVRQYMENYNANLIADAAISTQPTSANPVGAKISMLPENIKLINSGAKTQTIRTEYLDNGVYTMPDNTLIAMELVGKGKVQQIGGKNTIAINPDIYGYAENVMDVDQFGRNEGFKDWADFVKNNKFSKEFVSGKAVRYIYNVTPVEPKCS